MLRGVREDSGGPRDLKMAFCFLTVESCLIENDAEVMWWFQKNLPWGVFEFRWGVFEAITKMSLKPSLGCFWGLPIIPDLEIWGSGNLGIVDTIHFPD